MLNYRLFFLSIILLVASPFFLFAQHVDSATAIIRGEQDFCPNDMSEDNLPDFKRLLRILDQINSQRNAHNFARYIGELKKISIDERAHVVILVNMGHKTASMVYVVLLKIIRILNDHILYWQAQGNLGVSYYMHRSPTRLFDSATQYQEIDANIGYLRQLQAKYFVQLGMLHQIIARFNDKASVDELYVWLEQLIEILQSQPFIKDSYPISRQYKKMCGALERIVGRLPYYTSHIDIKIGKARMPGSFNIINIIKLSGALALVSYFFMHPNIISDVRSKMFIGWNNFYKNNVDGPMNMIKEALWGGEKTTHTEADEIIDLMTRAINKQIGAETIAELLEMPDAAELGASRQQFERLYVQVLQEYWNEVGATAASSSANNRSISLAARARNLDVEYLNQILVKIVGDISKQSTVKVPFFGSAGPTKISSVEMFGRLVVVMIQAIRWRSIEFKEDMTEPVNQLATLVKRVLDQSQITAAIVAMIPAALVVGLAGYVVKNGIGKYWGKKPYNFRYTRFALHDLHQLLNVQINTCMRDMTIEDQGRILFFVDKLRLDAKNHVRYDHKHHFLSDIRLLVQPDLSNRQKIEVIHSMWNTYTFLKAGYRISAA